MSNFPSKETVAQLRARFPQGCRVELVRMNDPFTNLRPGNRGRVDLIDDAGTAHCTWDNGSTLGVAYGVDYVVRVDGGRCGMTNTVGEHWSEGIVAHPATGVKYKYWIKHYDKGSEFGIDGGRISKLTIRRTGETGDLCSYDRGWDVEPADEVKVVYDIILAKYN